MSIRRWLILGWMVAGLQILSVAQDQSSQAPTAQDTTTQTQDPTNQSSGDDGTIRTAPAPALSGIVGMESGSSSDDTNNDDLPRIPSLLGGSGTSTAFVSEMKRQNYLRGGLNVSAFYDSNPLLLSAGAQSNTSETIFPNIAIEESTSRMRWTLGYAGGLTVNQNITAENQGSQNLNFNSQFRLSPHVNLRVAENFSIVSGFFDAGTGTGVVAGSGGPNTTLIAPLATQRSSVTTVEANYHFALNDVIGASGSFYDLHFTNVPPGTELTDSQTASGSAFWLHRTYHEDWTGVSYHFDRIISNPGNDETLVHSFLVVNTLSLWKRLTLSGFIGPQYSQNQGLVIGVTQPTQSGGWSVSGGLEGGWQGERTSVAGGFSRSISDGGGVLGAVTLQNFHANFRRILIPGWSVALAVNRGTNQSIFATGASSINATSAGISLDRNVGKSIGVHFGYIYNFQRQFGVPGSAQTFDASQNRIFVTLSYSWAKPLGM